MRAGEQRHVSCETAATVKAGMQGAILLEVSSLLGEAAMRAARARID